MLASQHYDSNTARKGMMRSLGMMALVCALLSAVETRSA